MHVRWGQAKPGLQQLPKLGAYLHHHNKRRASRTLT